MSFCFVGGMTFLGASFKSVVSHPIAVGLAIGFLAIWFLAFVLAVKVNSKSHYFMTIPGKGDGISFLPDSALRNKFYSTKAKPFDADEYCMKDYLEQHGVDTRSMDYGKILSSYQDLIKDLSDVSKINKNAWLASLVYISIAQAKENEKTFKYFSWYYALLCISMVCLIAAVIVSMF